MSYDGRWETIRVAVDDGIAWLELHRPEKRIRPGLQTYERR